jgi:hypothetical protein
MKLSEPTQMETFTDIYVADARLYDIDRNAADVNTQISARWGVGQCCCSKYVCMYSIYQYVSANCKNNTSSCSFFRLI